MTSHQDTTWISSQILYLVWCSFQVVWSSVGLKRCIHSLMDDSLLNYIQLSDQTDAHKCKLDAWQISKGISKNTCQGLCWNIATQQWRAHGLVMSRKSAARSWVVMLSVSRKNGFTTHLEPERQLPWQSNQYLACNDIAWPDTAANTRRKHTTSQWVADLLHDNVSRFCYSVI